MSKQWILWGYIDKGDGKRVKMPMDMYGGICGSTHKDEYETFDTAFKQSKIVGRSEGPAFCFTPEDDFVGVDIDDCLMDHGTLKDWAVPIITAFHDNYMEISPSMTGVKIWCIGKVPEGMRHSMPYEDGAIEIYENGRMFSFTGFSFSHTKGNTIVQDVQLKTVGEGDVAINWLNDSYFKPHYSQKELQEVVSAQPIAEDASANQAAAAYFDHGSDDKDFLKRRAVSYAEAAEMPPAGAGRNSACFRLAGNLFALEQNGTRLSQSEVLAVVKHFCDVNGATPRRGEVEDCVESAAKGNGTPPASKPHVANTPDWIPTPTSEGLAVVEGFINHQNNISIQVNQQVNQFAIAPHENLVDQSPVCEQAPHQPQIASQATKVISRGGYTHDEHSRRPFPTEVLKTPGLLSEIANYTISNAMFPLPKVSFAGAIAMMSSLIGRAVIDELGTTPNVYMVALAPSGGGKDFPRKTNKAIAETVGGALKERLGPERIGSSAGFVAQLMDQPSTLFQLDEFGLLLSRANSPKASPHLEQLFSTMMQLYSSAGGQWIGDAYADTQRTPRISRPSATIFGTATSNQFWGSMTTDSICDGFVGRLMFMDDGYGEFNEQPVKMGLGNIVQACNYWLQAAASAEANDTPYVIKYTDDARERLNQHIRDITERRCTEEKYRAAIWSRASEKTTKLALLFASSRDPLGRICFQDIDAAIALSNWMANEICVNVESRVSDNDFDKAIKKFFRILKKEKSISRSDMLRKMRCTSKFLTEIVNTAQQREEVEITKTGTGATFYNHVPLF